MAKIGETIDRIPLLIKVMVAGLVCISAGWSGHVLFAQQVELPKMVGETISRVSRLENRMDLVETVVTDVAMNSQRLRVLESKVDSLGDLGLDTYCIVRAHALGLDASIECTLNRWIGAVFQ